MESVEEQMLVGVLLDRVKLFTTHPGHIRGVWFIYTQTCVHP